MYERETWATTRYLCPDRCILYMGSLWEPEDPLHLSYDKCSVTVSFTLQHGNGTMLEILWPHHTQCSWWRPSACSCCCVLRFASLHQTGNEAPVRPNHTWLKSHRIGSETTEHRSFLCMEEGSVSRTLAFNCGHGYAQEEYVTKREERSFTACMLLLMAFGLGRRHCSFAQQY